VAIAILTAELAGYVLHRVMHSERFPVLSRAHMIRHFELYGPAQSMRSAVYRRATDGRASLGNIGMEWVVPSAITLGTCWAVMWALHVAWKYEVLVLAILLGWPMFMFSYLHDRMPLEKFWMYGICWFAGQTARRGTITNLPGPQRSSNLNSTVMNSLGYSSHHRRSSVVTL